MKTFYFTYGFGQRFQGGYTKVTAKNMSAAREIFHKEAGPYFSFAYDSRDDCGVDRFNLKEIPLEEAHKNRPATKAENDKKTADWVEGLKKK